MRHTVVSVRRRPADCAGEARPAGVEWPTTAADATSSRFCPDGYAGVARRRCRRLPAGQARWLEPDFSACARNDVHELERQVPPS